MALVESLEASGDVEQALLLLTGALKDADKGADTDAGDAAANARQKKRKRKLALKPHQVVLLRIRERKMCAELLLTRARGEVGAAAAPPTPGAEDDEPKQLLHEAIQLAVHGSEDGELHSELLHLVLLWVRYWLGDNSAVQCVLATVGVFEERKIWLAAAVLRLALVHICLVQGTPGIEKLLEEAKQALALACGSGDRGGDHGGNGDGDDDYDEDEDEDEGEDEDEEDGDVEMSALNSVKGLVRGRAGRADRLQLRLYYTLLLLCHHCRTNGSAQVALLDRYDQLLYRWSTCRERSSGSSLLNLGMPLKVISALGLIMRGAASLQQDSASAARLSLNEAESKLLKAADEGEAHATIVVQLLTTVRYLLCEASLFESDYKLALEQIEALGAMLDKCTSEGCAAVLLEEMRVRLFSMLSDFAYGASSAEEVERHLTACFNAVETSSALLDPIWMLETRLRVIVLELHPSRMGSMNYELTLETLKVIIEEATARKLESIRCFAVLATAVAHLRRKNIPAAKAAIRECATIEAARGGGHVEMPRIASVAAMCLRYMADCYDALGVAKRAVKTASSGACRAAECGDDLTLLACLRMLKAHSSHDIMLDVENESRYEEVKSRVKGRMHALLNE